MIVLDENIADSQRELLRSWRIHVRQIGYDLGRKGMQDSEIVPFLRRLDRPTFFSLDRGFYTPILCHPKYCLVSLAVGDLEVAAFVRRLLSHAHFSRTVSRMGKVVRASQVGLRSWRLHAQAEAHRLRLRR